MSSVVSTVAYPRLSQMRKPIVTLNLSSVFVQSYPDTSPWDHCKDMHLETLLPSIGTSSRHAFPDQVKAPALAQAQRTGVNPFWFVSMSNPFFLDHPSLEDAYLPFKGYHLPPPLPDCNIISDGISDVEQIRVGDGRCILRIKLDGQPRVLKLFLEAEQAVVDGSPSRFAREFDAYSHLAHYGACDSDAVAKCYGWFTLEAHSLEDLVTSLQLARPGPGYCWKGLVLEDLTGFLPLSIHNISGPIAQLALKALYKVHSAFVQHSDLGRMRIMVTPGAERVAWIGFGRASCGGGAVSRQSLFHELAQAWALLYQKLIPDALLGFEDDSAAGTKLWKGRMVAPSTQRSPSTTCLKRVPHTTVETAIQEILLAYPEKNVLDWDPPIYNLIPEPLGDDHHDSVELLAAIKDCLERGRTLDNPFMKWYRTYPVHIRDEQLYSHPHETSYKEYSAPAPLTQIPSDVPLELIECISQGGSHPMLRVRLGGEERLLKAYSGGWPSSDEYEEVGLSDGKTVKERFDAEKSAYAHLVHYGVCNTGAVPFCYGWMELSDLNIAKMNALIGATMVEYVPETTIRRRPPFLDPMFADGSPAAALVLEYIPNTEVLETRNVTYALAESAMRAVTRIHGAYVRHGDLFKSQNILIVKEDPQRVVIVDFDHAKDVSSGSLLRAALRQELMNLWVMLYAYMIPDQRVERTIGSIDY